MPTFMQSLAANPSGGGIYGMPGADNTDVLGIVNQIKDRDLRDFKDKADFMSQLSERQQLRMRALLGPESDSGGDNQQGQPQNVQMGQDPNQMTGYQKGELGIRQQAQNLDSQKLAQQGKLGQEGLDIKTQQEQLNQQKSDQIRDQKINELQQKADKATADLKLSNDKLQANVNDHEAHIKFLTDKQAADDARKALQDARAQAAADDNKKKTDATIANLRSLVKNRDNPQSTDVNKTIIDAQGNKTTETSQTTKGNQPTAPVKNPDGSYRVVAPDGTIGNIPADKLDHWNANYGGSSSDDSNQDQSQQ